MSIRGVAYMGLLGLLLALPVTASQKGPQTIQAAKTVAPAPELKLQDLDGKQWKLSDHRGKVVAVNFWATWCPPCRKELPSMQNTREAFAKDGFEIVAVNVGENWETIAPFLENFSVTFPVLLDQNSEEIGKWKVLGLPTTFLVDADGKITHRINGGRDWDDPAFRKELKQIIRSH